MLLLLLWIREEAMSDVNAHLIQPLKKFAKDSIHLVKKCTKPDRKGQWRLLDVSGALGVSLLALCARPHRGMKIQL